LRRPIVSHDRIPGHLAAEEQAGCLEHTHLAPPAVPKSQWSPGRNQIDDRQFLAGAIFAVSSYDDAHQAIHDIVSEGEGTKESPLDFEGEVSHYYRFAEVFYDQVLTKAEE
jgi:hypothetical protein